MQIRFWGVRGTIPTPGPHTVRVGGNTSCVEVHTVDKQLIILDAGSGIRALGKALQSKNQDRIIGNILISHTHWDHIQGFPFFGPVFGRNNRFVLVGQKRFDKRLEEVLEGQFIEPYLPFRYRTLPADLLVKEVQDGETLIIGNETKVTVADLNHPGGCLGFRIESGDSVFTYCSDVGHDGTFDENVLKLAQNADFFVHDSHFKTVEECKLHADWGHSTWLDATQVAIEANVKQLGLFHFSPDMTDDDVEEILGKAKKVFPNTIIAKEGLEITLP
ncbi:MAG: MBL fold metallo-hydrolase [Chloroflexota bacterium]